MIDIDSLYTKSVLVIDAKTQEVLFEKNAELELEPASLTKLASCLWSINSLRYLANQQKKTLEDFLEEEILITDYHIKSRPSNLGLKAGDRIKISNLFKAALVPSKNDCAKALGIHIAQLFNKSYKEIILDLNFWLKTTLKCKNTKFLNFSGLHIKNLEKQAYTTSLDMYKILKAVDEDKDLKKYAEIKDNIDIEYYSIEEQKYINKILTRSDLIGNRKISIGGEAYNNGVHPDYYYGVRKSGYTPSAKHTFAAKMNLITNKSFYLIFLCSRTRTLHLSEDGSKILEILKNL